MPDTDAARVAEVRHVLERCVGTYQSVALSPQDAAAWLAALTPAERERDALAARLADLEATLATAQLRIGELFDLRGAAERERDALATEHAHLKDVMRFGLGDPMCGIVSYSGPCGEPLACGWPPHGTERAHSWATLPTFTEANDAD